MLNVPSKFNQVCRLCLTLVEPKGTHDSDEIIKKLSIFGSNNNFNNNGQQGSQMSSIDNKKSNDDDQLNKKINKRSNEISISLSGGGNTSVINNGFIDDDSDEDITERIFECLSIKVSHFFRTKIKVDKTCNETTTPSAMIFSIKGKFVVYVRSNHIKYRTIMLYRLHITQSWIGL